MNLNSLAFVAFLAGVTAVHFVLPVRLRNWFLLLVSYGFYMLWQPKFALLLAGTTVLTYGAARFMASRPGHKKTILVLALLAQFGTLLFYKYLGFFTSLIAPSLTLPSILLPVGISFYTFAVCGYLIDVYRGRQAAVVNLGDYALFVSFFPTVLSGPIERVGHLLPQIQSPRRWEAENAKEGVLRFLVGLFKKMVIADQLAILVGTVFAAPEAFTGVQLLAGAVCYSIQIYCDFSAYSDMAIGAARLLGFRLLENFDAPYFSTSVKEFWRRWHMSLSGWFRDYLYFPLGGSRKGKIRTYVNLLVVFAVSGLWHGAAMTFVVWGLLNGVYQVIGSLLEKPRTRLWAALGLGPGAKLRRGLQMLVTFVLLTVTWVFFRADSLPQALLILKRICTPSGGVFPLAIGALGLSRAQLASAGLAVLLLALCELLGKKREFYRQLSETVWVRYGFYVAILTAILIFGAYGSGYNAQDFVYFKF